MMSEKIRKDINLFENSSAGAGSVTWHEIATTPLPEREDVLAVRVTKNGQAGTPRMIYYFQEPGYPDVMMGWKGKEMPTHWARINLPGRS
jgi:hypothetical protein